MIASFAPKALPKLSSESVDCVLDELVDFGDALSFEGESPSFGCDVCLLGWNRESARRLSSENSICELSGIVGWVGGLLV